VVEHAFAELARGPEAALVEGRLVEREKSLGEIGVVLEVAVELGRAALLPRPQQAPRRSRGSTRRKAALAPAAVVVAAEHARGVGEGGQHEAVQAVSTLSSRAGRAALARHEQPPAHRLKTPLDVLDGHFVPLGQHVRVDGLVRDRPPSSFRAV
jgi:hypothetical protein